MANKKRSFGSCLIWLLVIVLFVIGINYVTDGLIDDIVDEIDYIVEDWIEDRGSERTSDIEEDSKYEVYEDTTVEISQPAVIEPVSFERDHYYPLNNCAPSRLHVGDRAMVSLGGGKNGIRSTPDTHPSDNIIYRAPSGEGLWIIGGPKCNYGWILWKVETDTGYVGWTPESPGDEFWLTPIEAGSDMLTEIRRDPDMNEAYEKVSSTLHDEGLSDREKKDKLKVYQNTYGEEVVATVLRYVPVYTGNGNFTSFDSWAKDLSKSSSGSSSGDAPIDNDPVGATIRILSDPSPENITEMLGLDDW